MRMRNWEEMRIAAVMANTHLALEFEIELGR